MSEKNVGIVLRSPTIHKSTLTLFDKSVGKIEALNSPGEVLSSGSLVSYGLKKGRVRYFLQDVALLDMPFGLARVNVMFLHHILELCDYFVPWEGKNEELFTLMEVIYKNHEMIATPQGQKLFLNSFFKYVGEYSEEVANKKGWAAFIARHPQLLSLRTASFLKVLEGYEEPA